jgi:hypothetical protein
MAGYEFTALMVSAKDAHDNSRRGIIRTMRSMILILLMAAPAMAQTTRPASVPATPPSPTTRPAQRSAEEMLRQMLQPANQGAQPLKPIPDIAPQNDVTGGANATAPDAPTQRLDPEGALMLDRIGRVSRGKESKWLEFHFDSDGRSMTDPPLLLLPNKQLMQLEDLLLGTQSDLSIRVLSGELTEYRGRNYLLITRWTQVADVTQPLR